MSENLGIKKVHKVTEILDSFLLVYPNMNRKNSLSDQNRLFECEGYREGFVELSKVHEFPNGMSVIEFFSEVHMYIYMIKISSLPYRRKYILMEIDHR